MALTEDQRAQLSSIVLALKHGARYDMEKITVVPIHDELVALWIDWIGKMLKDSDVSHNSS